MKVTFLDGPSLAEKFPELIDSCRGLDIAIAYIKMSGLRTFLKNLDVFMKRGSLLRIVFGLSSRQGITDKESAENLLKLSKHSNVDVRKINHSGFHPKLFIFNGAHPCIVVGSANLTEAAQSTNAEANLLIENADNQLLESALTFFKHYFDTAPKLKRKDVDLYKPRERRGDRVFFGGQKEDTLPSPLRRKNELEMIWPNKLWKIAPGSDAHCWEEWVNAIDDDGEGMVAIGWDVGDLVDFDTYDSLREAVKQKAEDDWNRNWGRKIKVKYVTDQLWTFKNDISIGDVFVVYSESRVLGIAIVTEESKYQYKGSRSISYENQINVKYKWYKEWITRADDKIVETLGKQGTLRLVEEDWLWDYLVERLP